MITEEKGTHVRVVSVINLIQFNSWLLNQQAGTIWLDDLLTVGGGFPRRGELDLDHTGRLPDSLAIQSLIQVELAARMNPVIARNVQSKDMLDDLRDACGET